MLVSNEKGHTIFFFFNLFIGRRILNHCSTREARDTLLIQATTWMDIKDVNLIEKCQSPNVILLYDSMFITFFT